MSNIIKPKRSNTASAIPTTGQLASGEIAVNMADKKVYINNGTDVVQVGAGNVSGLGDVSVVSPANGQSFTYNSTTSKWQNSTVTTYSLATSTVAGLIELGSDTQQTVAANAVSATASRSYALQVNAAGQGVVNVPWTDTNSGGTVTSVGGTGTVSGLSLSGTVTTSGNLTLGGTLAVTASNFASQTAKTFLSAPNATAGVPTFREIVASDIPTLNQNTTGSSASCTGNAATATTATNATNTAITNDTTTATAQYITFVAASSGNTGQKTHSTGLTFVPSTGSFTASGNVTAYSDENLKTDWASVGPDFVNRLSMVKSGTYTRIDTGERQAGSSAQDWQKLLPEVVSSGEHLSLAYGNAALVAVIELSKRVIEQDAKIAKLEKLVANLMGN